MVIFKNIFGSVKVEKYICIMNTKTLKIPEHVHQELKVFIAQNKDNMTEFSGLAIMKELKERGHKFIHPVKKQKATL